LLFIFLGSVINFAVDDNSRALLALYPRHFDLLPHIRLYPIQAHFTSLKAANITIQQFNKFNIEKKAQTILDMNNIVSYKKALRSITAVAVLERMEKMVTDNHRQWVLKELIKRRDMIKNA
jgi:hypothetical protein